MTYRTTAVIQINDDNCVGCRRCVNVCPSHAPAMEGRLAVLDEPNCFGCDTCAEACIPYHATSGKPDPNPCTLVAPWRGDPGVAFHRIQCEIQPTGAFQRADTGIEQIMDLLPALPRGLSLYALSRRQTGRAPQVLCAATSLMTASAR